MLSRILRTVPATLTHTFEIGEDGTDSTTPVTVAVTDATGASVTSGTATSAGAGSGRYTFPLPAQAQLATLTVAWTGTIASATVVERDTVAIVGGFLFTLSEGRNSDPSLSDTGKYTTDHLIAARAQTEAECEEICDRAFIPRYRRVVIDGSGSPEIVLPDNDIRTIRSVRMAPRIDGTFTAFTVAELAALAILPARVLTREDSALWTEGRSNVIVEYEYGMDAPPDDLVRASLRRFRWWLNIGRSTIPDRAVSWTGQDGTTYQLDLPSAFRTGLPDVDAVYARYSLRSTVDSSGQGRLVPASRTLDYDPQRNTLFHGGPR